MSLDDVKKQFVEQVKLRAYDDKYVDVGEEKEILQIAISQNISIDSARGALRAVCENNGYVLESVLDEKAKDMLDTFASNDGVVDKKEFDDTVMTVKKAANGKISESKIKKKVKKIILDNEWNVKEGMFKGGSWFSDI